MSPTARNSPVPRFTSAISCPSTTNRRASPSGTSSVRATSRSSAIGRSGQHVRCRDLRGDGLLQAPLDLRDRYPVQDFLEEPRHDEPLGLVKGDTPALQVEQ